MKVRDVNVLGIKPPWSNLVPALYFAGEPRPVPGWISKHRRKPPTRIEAIIPTVAWKKLVWASSPLRGEPRLRHTPTVALPVNGERYGKEGTLQLRGARCASSEQLLQRKVQLVCFKSSRDLLLPLSLLPFWTFG